MGDNEIDDVGDVFEPEPPPSQARKREGEGVPWAAITVGIWAVVLVIFSVQNRERRESEE